MGRDLWIALRASDGQPQEIPGPVRRSLAAARRLRLREEWPGEQCEVRIDSNGETVATREACSVIAHFRLQQASYYYAHVNVSYYSADYGTQFLLAHWNNTNRCWQPTPCSFRLSRRAGGAPGGPYTDGCRFTDFRLRTQAPGAGSGMGTDARDHTGAPDPALAGGESASDSDLTEGGI